MPGIAGIIRKSRYDEIDQDVGLMLEMMRHSPRAKEGMYVDEPSGIWVGWSCHPRSYSDCMPLVAERHNVVIIFQGEHYASSELSDGLPPNRDTARADARYLLDLYDAFGEDFLSSLNGWYSGVVLDRQRKRVTLFNDRYAMGRIYYYETSEEFVFASEAKCLLKIRPHLRRLSKRAVAEQLAYNCVVGPQSLYANISLLPHAAAWTFECGESTARRAYFDFREWEKQPELEFEEFYSRWAKTISDVFPRYAEEGDKVAVSLTAGLDTRLIVAALGDGNRRHPAYTFCGPWGELYDVRKAREAARVYGQDFNVIRINEKFLNEFADYANKTVWISDGCHDAFGAHDVFFNEIAQDIAPIRLTGKFGSEIVRIRRLVGTQRYASGVLRDELLGIVNELPDFQTADTSKHPLTRVLTEEISWHEYGRVVVEQAYLTMRTPYMDNALAKLMYQAPRGSRAAGDLQERYVREFGPEFAAFITNFGRFLTPNPVITKLVHFPFWALFKLEYIYLHATPHWLTRLDRKAANLHLELLLSGRQKWEGYRIWINTHFSDFIQDTLLNPDAEYTEYFDYSTISQMVRRHVAGTHNYLHEINRALSLQLIHTNLLR